MSNADAGYATVERGSDEWDRMWAKLSATLHEHCGDLWDTVWQQCAYMGESVTRGFHSFRAKELELPGGAYIGRLYVDVPDGRLPDADSRAAQVYGVERLAERKE